jgi:hypothetical protein
MGERMQPHIDAQKRHIGNAVRTAAPAFVAIEIVKVALVNRMNEPNFPALFLLLLVNTKPRLVSLPSR